ncbi:DUF4365 domain-containing protein [Stenotrophomonas maltophilia]|nr:DUF4365 domain-containing protein [Stenotrophomonas maltophilia]
MTEKKQRTRQHVIADLSANHVSYGVYQSGFTIETAHHDYGTDGMVFTFDSGGFQENGFIALQFKSTDNLGTYQISSGFSYPIDIGDLKLWNDDIYPVYLILYDAVNEKAFWVHVQSYLKTSGFDPSKSTTKTHNVRLPASNVFDPSTPRIWQEKKEKINAKLLKELRK